MSPSWLGLDIYCELKSTPVLPAQRGLKNHRMLAVMTLNIGYFFSVLGGTFLGEVAVGRYAQLEEH